MTTQPFTGKVIAVTGAGIGICRATTMYLAQRRASLTFSDVNKASVDAAAVESLSHVPDAKIVASLVDVSKADQVLSWIAQDLDEFGKLDGAANIAGTGVLGESAALEYRTEEGWKFVLDINLSGTMYCMREELKVLSEEGSIVNASSVLGLRRSPTPGSSPFVVSKNGVMGLISGAIAIPMMGQEGEGTPLAKYIRPPIPRW